MKRALDIKTRLMGKGLTISTVETECCPGAYETLVFHRTTGYVEWDGARYKSEAAARRGHKEFVTRWKAKTRKQIRDELAKKKGTASE